MNDSSKYVTTQNAAARVLDAFYLEARVMSEAEYAPYRNAMRMTQCVSAIPVTPSRAAIVHPAVVTRAIRTQAKRGAHDVAVHPWTNDQISNATLYALSRANRAETGNIFPSFTQPRKPSCGHPT